MKRFFAAVMSVAVFAALAPVADAQSQCPAEVSQAQAMLQKVSKAQDVQAQRTAPALPKLHIANHLQAIG